MRVVLVSPEMAIPQLGEPMCGANFRGGLGLLAGDIAECLNNEGSITTVCIVPFHGTHWLSRASISYEGTLARLWGLLPEREGREPKIPVWVIHRGRCDIYGVSVPGVLYTGDRRERLSQEVLLGHILPVILKGRSSQPPDILWLNEGHTVVALARMRDDDWFKSTRFLFTTHTARPEGRERFPADWFEDLGISPSFRPIFMKDGCMDFTAAAMTLAHGVTAVSKEHADVTKEMFPEHRTKITGIRNGLSPSLWQSPSLTALDGNVPYSVLTEAQEAAKAVLIELIERKTGIRLNPRKALGGLVRRVAWYKNQLPMLAPIIEAVCAERGEVISTPFGNLEGLGLQVFIAGVAHEDDGRCQEWTRDFEQWMERPQLKGRFVYVRDYTFELLQLGPQGCELWPSCSLPGDEACGQSDQRATLNGNVNVATKTGGAMEYIKEVDPESGEGNGCFIEPYGPLTLYEKLKLLSNLYHATLSNGDPRWARIRMNSLESSNMLDGKHMVNQYKTVFASLQGGST